PWGGTAERPLGLLPMSPEAINTRYFLVTRENPDYFQVLSTSNFKPNRKTRFIIHGFVNTAERGWQMEMCQVMLEVEDVNCFCIDWRGGSFTLYTQAANNIRVVGAELASFIGYLSKNYDYSPSMIHIIGHSLGAHVAGEAGKRVPGIARISGLDPAGPLFQNTPPEVRLDPTDADFVDAIHTDTSPLIPKIGLGMAQSVGHLDFFPNGGQTMPGCGSNIITRLLDIEELWGGADNYLACNHLRSYKYYTESIRTPDAFVAFPSDTYEAFMKGTGFPCPSTGCPLMGYYAGFYGRGTLSGLPLYLNTGDVSPYARWRYKVTVKTSGILSFMGDMKVTLHRLKRNSKEIASGFTKLGGTYSAFIDSKNYAGSLTNLSYNWIKSLIDLIPGTVGADTVTVQYGRDGQTYQFCGKEQVRDNVLQNLTPCDSL
uniref:Triacylglycerol lipase n=1 Tax=Xenopus tropicalis TaxID=8364 RepID=F6R032_XENTR